MKSGSTREAKFTQGQASTLTLCAEKTKQRQQKNVKGKKKKEKGKVAHDTMSQGSLAKLKHRLSIKDKQMPHALSPAHFCVIRQFHCAVVAFVDIPDTINQCTNQSIVFGRGRNSYPIRTHHLYQLHLCSHATNGKTQTRTSNAFILECVHL